MTIITGKTCNNCRQFKPVSEYSKGMGKLGLRTFCKKCRSQVTMSRYFELQQRMYEEWHNKGYKNIKFCECGNYYSIYNKPEKTNCGRCEK